MKVSVIIPTLNEEALICDAVNSAVVAGADEVIVADGGSTDRTVSLVADMAIIVKSATAGRAVQQNSGAAVASGDLFLFLHADCQLHANAISELRERCQHLPEFTVACFQQRIDHPGWKYRVVEAGNQCRVRLLGWAYGDQGISVSGQAFRDIGGFADVAFLEDLLLMKSLKRRNGVLLLSSPLKVSARRWQRRGMFWQTLRNWCIVLAAQLGASPNWLAKFYPNDR